MPLAHPVFLRNLVNRYETLAAAHAGAEGRSVRGEFDEVSHMLCVATGTRDVKAALTAAAHRLPGARVGEGAPLSV
ncbi:DUF5133 domain-containing protein [Streptomyces sp. NPDC088725]|uniref:DUF5133 domain-containing protein n=1 Tax=Streptomyces sp. NPDC088725 TaxID=3365873 RepID=UPI0038177DAE